MKYSFLNSTTSLIVFLVCISVMAMGLLQFWRTGEVLDIFNSLFSAFVGAYLQKSVSSKVESEKTPNNPLV